MKFLAFNALERVSVQQIDTGSKSDNDSATSHHTSGDHCVTERVPGLAH